MEKLEEENIPNEKVDVKDDSFTAHNRHVVHILRSTLWRIACLAVVISAVAATRFPGRVPVHFGLHGKADRWGSPSTLFWLSVGVNVGFAVLWLIMEVLIRRFASVNDNNGISKFWSVTILLVSGIIAETVFLIILLSFIRAAFPS
jgi:uncharacterized membrane protein